MAAGAGGSREVYSGHSRSGGLLLAQCRRIRHGPRPVPRALSPEDVEIADPRQTSPEREHVQDEAGDGKSKGPPPRLRDRASQHARGQQPESGEDPAGDRRPPSTRLSWSNCCDAHAPTLRPNSERNSKEERKSRQRIARAVRVDQYLTSKAVVIRLSDLRRSGVKPGTKEPGGPVLPPGGVTPPGPEK
jgi:hypothetical protein